MLKPSCVWSNLKGEEIMERQTILTIYKNERGVSAILVTILIIVILGFVALALDTSHLVVARNELQNAADAGALAGARYLYNDEGTLVNEGANQIAYNAATANKSEKVAVEVNWTAPNSGDVLRGHWSFGYGSLARGFYVSNNTSAPELWDHSTVELDEDPNFVNAVQVTTRRETTPILALFARIFNIDSFQLTADAVAWIGFAGTLEPFDVDQPIAICAESLLINGEYSCSIGRMINSGQNIESSETGGWTSFNQDDPCSGGTNAQEVKSLVCKSGNPESIQLGGDMATNGGEIQSAFSELLDCWNEHIANDGPVPWNLTLPVVSCPGNNVGTCEIVKGAVNLNIIWITEAGEDPGYNDAPTQMGDWSSDNPDGQVRWNEFTQVFNLQNVDGSPAPYAKKSIYFLPDCTPHIPTGGSGGENFGVLAKYPKLVE